MKVEKHILQTVLRKRIYSFRKLHGLTQEQMAELLRVSPRSYCDQEQGAYGFSALSLISFLLLLNNTETLSFLEELQAALKSAGQEVA